MVTDGMHLSDMNMAKTPGFPYAGYCTAIVSKAPYYHTSCILQGKKQRNSCLGHDGSPEFGSIGKLWQGAIGVWLFCTPQETCPKPELAAYRITPSICAKSSLFFPLNIMQTATVKKKISSCSKFFNMYKVESLLIRLEW